MLNVATREAVVTVITTHGTTVTDPGPVLPRLDPKDRLDLRVTEVLSSSVSTCNSRVVPPVVLSTVSPVRLVICI